jgi:hypothetical protein
VPAVINIRRYGVERYLLVEYANERAMAITTLNLSIGTTFDAGPF